MAELKYYQHPSYKGIVVPMAERPKILADRHKFRKTTQEKLDRSTAEFIWNEAMKKKYGSEYKKIMKSEKLYN